MKPLHALSLGCALTLAAPLNALAQESGVSWNVSAVSEYLYRSVSQTDEAPTLQAEISWRSPIGVYAGSWASGVDFGPGSPYLEIDYYLGYGAEFDQGVGLDLRLARYTTPGDSDTTWNEFITTVTLPDAWSAAFHYTNDVFASSTTGWYAMIGKSFELPYEMTLSADLGRSFFRNNGVVGRDYTDWNIGVSRTFGRADVTLAYYGADSDGRWNYGKYADNRLFLSVSIGN